MVTYPGLPAPVVSDFLSREASRDKYAGKAEFNIGRIEMVANTGTYIDAPFHRFDGGADVGQLPLEKLAFLAGVVVQLQERRALEGRDIASLDVQGRALLVNTGWSKHWRTEEYGAPEHPYVSAEAARQIVAAGVALVGIDSVNIDDMADPSRPAHTELLRAGIPIVEHLTNLDALGNRAFTFFAVPPPVRTMGTFAVRAFARME